MIAEQLSPQVVAKLNQLIKRAEHIANTTVEDCSLFGDKTNLMARLAIKMFDGDIFKRGTPLSRNLIAALEKHIPGLPDDPIEAYQIANSPCHDIRNFMIRNEDDLLEEQ